MSSELFFYEGKQVVVEKLPYAQFVEDTSHDISEHKDSIVTMNADCYHNIISFLDISDNRNISLVSKLFYQISKNESIWKSFFKKKFYAIDCTKQFYHNYKKCHNLNKFLVRYKKNINSIDEELYLDNNQLQSIPSEIGQLSTLKTLYLDNNQLQSIPSEIGQLSMLQELYLAYNQLQSIPPEIGRLSMLRELSLYGNQLQSIPSEIGQLSMLQELHLDNNQLQSIPPEISQLSKLQMLYLGNNRLQSIPPEIGQLNMLRRLYLDNDQLKLVPDNINKNIIELVY